jgi:hypothetical protein
MIIDNFLSVPDLDEINLISDESRMTPLDLSEQERKYQLKDHQAAEADITLDDETFNASLDMFDDEVPRHVNKRWLIPLLHRLFSLLARTAFPLATLTWELWIWVTYKTRAISIWATLVSSWSRRWRPLNGFPRQSCARQTPEDH